MTADTIKQLGGDSTYTVPSIQGSVLLEFEIPGQHLECRADLMMQFYDHEARWGKSK